MADSREQKRSAPEVHPDYDLEDADIALISSEGVQFRIHALILKLVSTVFKDMLAIKRADGDGPIALMENATTLSTLLDMVYPARRPPAALTILHFRAVATAADKYDMGSVTRSLQDVILGKNHTTSLTPNDNQTSAMCTAVEKYFVASDLGWTAVTKDIIPHIRSPAT